MDTDSIEKRVADTVLERTTEVLTIDGHDYPLAPPTLGTIIMVSELAATLPQIEDGNANLLGEVLRNARHCRTVGKITAVLLLGAKRVLETRQVAVDAPRPAKAGWLSRILRRKAREAAVEETVAEVDKLADAVINEVSPATLQAVLTRRLIDMQIADFFALTTSLTTANQLKPTREVETAATASGE